jgi:hypothetical protein
MRGSGQGPIRRAIKQWAYRYRVFAQDRFKRFSRGGGNWPALKYGRKRGSKGAASILFDTGTLFKALHPTFIRKPGQLEKHMPFGVRVGFGGPGGHPNAPMTVSELARIHDQGLGFMPERRMIIKPTSRVIKSMAADMERALKKTSRGMIG